MSYASNGDVQIYYERLGRPGDPLILLVMGLGMQATAWDKRFCNMLVERGYSVVRFDNRDSGLSTSFEATESAAYSLEDMAQDVIAVLDAVDVERAHVVGASMGAMVAQVLAIEHGERVSSLVSMMGTTGDPSVGQPTPEAMAALYRLSQAVSSDEVIAGTAQFWRSLESGEHGLSDRQMAALVERDIARAHVPGGARRQLMAVLSAPDRTDDLARVSVPVSVIHGAADRLVDVSGGRATAAAIPHAELVIIEGMGHGLPFAKWPDIVDVIVDTATRAGPN